MITSIGPVHDHNRILHDKTCFCIGPDKCNNKSCKLVQEYNKDKIR